jgi:hypothetical protein
MEVIREKREEWWGELNEKWWSERRVKYDEGSWEKNDKVEKDKRRIEEGRGVVKGIRRKWMMNWARIHGGKKRKEKRKELWEK